MLEKQNNGGLPIAKMVLASVLLVGALAVSFQTADAAGTYVLTYSYDNNLEDYALANSISTALCIWWLGAFLSFAAYLFYMASVARKLPPQTAMFKAGTEKSY